jgi:hypothetical protein
MMLSKTISKVRGGIETYDGEHLEEKIHAQEGPFGEFEKHDDGIGGTGVVPRA